MSYYSDVAVSCYRKDFLEALERFHENNDIGEYHKLLLFLGEFNIVIFKYDAHPEADMYLMTINCKWDEDYTDVRNFMTVIRDCEHGGFYTRIGEDPDDIEHQVLVTGTKPDSDWDFNLCELVALRVGLPANLDDMSYRVTAEPRFEYDLNGGER